MTSVEFANTLSSPYLTHLHGYCSLTRFSRIKRMMLTGDLLDAFGNSHIIIVFTYMTVIEILLHLVKRVSQGLELWVQVLRVGGSC